MDVISRIFLDTNVYIVCAADLSSYEYQILKWAGFEQKNSVPVEVVVSGELIAQISRVTKRLQNKDWGGELIGRIWQNFQICYVLFKIEDFDTETLAEIPQEDIGIYLTAKLGKAKFFVSSNHELVRALAQKTGEFECLTPEEFVRKYL